MQSRKFYQEPVTMSMSGVQRREWRGCRGERRMLLRLAVLNILGVEFFLKLTSPKGVSQTLLSQIRTRTRFSHRPSDNLHLLWQTLVTVCCIVSSFWRILPAVLAVSAVFCIALQGGKRSPWDIFQSVIIIPSQPAWRRIIRHPAPARISKHKPRQISIFGFA